MAQTHINVAFAGNRDDLNNQTLGYFNSFVKGKKCCILHYITPFLISTLNENSPYRPGMYLEKLKTQKPQAAQAEQLVCELICEPGTS
jgi:hypothetical protein